jgi:hypothetical protein
MNNRSHEMTFRIPTLLAFVLAASALGAQSASVSAHPREALLLPEAAPMEMLEQVQKLTSSDGLADDALGSSVAISGTFAIVGAPTDDIAGNASQGSAYIFEHDGHTWVQRAKLTAEDGFPQDNFGTSVAIHGDTVVIGAENDDVVFANDNQGSAYVFTKVAGLWVQQAKITSSDGTSGDEFGRAVAIYGSTVVVGAPSAEVQGAAYVFTRAGTLWTQQVRLGAAAPTGVDQFGHDVAIDNDTIVVGAPRHDVGPSGGSQGAVFCFTGPGGVWSEQARLTAQFGGGNDELGYSVSISGDLVVAGAWRDDIGENSNQGSAYAFVRTGSAWTELAKFLAPDGAAADQFGYSISVAGNLIVVGARDDDVGIVQLQGSAYAFRHDGAAVTHLNKLVASDGMGNDRFGGAVAATDQVALIGAHWDDVGSNNNQGSVYAFQRRSDAILIDGFE